MSIIFTKSILSEIKKLLNAGKILLSKDAKVIFICGAALDAHKGKNARKRFLDYAEKHLNEYDIFIAEKFFDVFGGTTDLLTIEENLAYYSDCIIIFIESESSIAELGAFANNDKLAKQILLVNKIDYINSPSFISKGPIAKVDNISIYGNTIYANFDRILQSVEEIKKRLEVNKNKYNKGINIDSYEMYKTITKKGKMLFLLDLVTLLQPITFRELLLIHKSIIGDGSYQLEFDIKLLIALGYIIEINGFYVKSKRHTKMFYVFEKHQSVLNIRSLIMSSYRKHDRKRIAYYLDHIRNTK